jgi:hypothetical protein
MPVVITGAVNWPALEKWDDDYLVHQCKDKRFRSTSAGARMAASFTMADYLQYCAKAKDETPLYLFERGFAKIAPELAKDFEVPAYFKPGTLAGHGTDLFALLGAERRPDHKWLIMGPGACVYTQYAA